MARQWEPANPDDAMARFRDLLSEVLPRNRFYAAKYQGLDTTVESFRSPADLARLPFTLKSELVADQASHPPYGQILTYPRNQYCRLHQTSGTSSGRPLRWLDTLQSWEWLLRCWQLSFPIMEISRHDIFFFPFSFGPFLGFWTAFEAASRAGYLCIPGGGMSSTARLRFLIEHQATVVCCTPTYALHLAELAAQEGIDLAGSAVRSVIVAGEPGGSIPATRRRIETVWGARVFDHYGMTEIGPVAVEARETPRSLVVLASEYLVEVIDPVSGLPVESGDVGELVLTNLGRSGCPLIRYRTGDLVQLRRATSMTDPSAETLLLEGGIIGRTDDMIHLRGNNLYPGAIEAVIRRFTEVVEYRILVDQTGPLTNLRIEIEPERSAQGTGLAEAVSRAIRDELLFRVEVTEVPVGSLPRYELKARRLVKLTV